MTVLLLDVGNSRCKWGLWRDGQITKSGALAHEVAADPGRWRFARGAAAAHACSVAAAETAAAIDAAIRESTGLSLSLAQVTASHAGVQCAYQDPTRLGVDRWMAVLCASRRTAEPVLVVDAGTAMTIDAIIDGDRHLGGLILPGVKLMERTLMKRTADIRVDEPAPPMMEFGASTSDAVRNGAMFALCGAVQQAAERLGYADASACPVLMTGGDGALLAEALGRPADYEPALVLEGLAIYAGLAE